MCGITGILKFNSVPIEQDILFKMTHSIKHRGPDGDNIWIHADQHIGFGHTRLAIIDLSEKGKQPMHFQNKYSITFNGEIYNYIEIKETLIKQGYHFHSDSDTEVILAGYDYYGIDILQELDGMFAFAIWDNVKQHLFCARDRFGEKPFYYSISNNTIIFASEMKALFATGIKKTINEKLLYFYLSYDLLEDPTTKQNTFYNNITKLEAGHYLIISKNGEIKKNKYWQLNITSTNHHIQIEDAIQQFDSLLQNSVKLRLRSDVPVGSSLSGGLDSSAIVAHINANRPKNVTQKSFSARFNCNILDEGPYMKAVSDYLNIEAHYTFPDEKELINNYEKIFYHQEEPFGSGSVFAQWEVMKLAKDNNTKVLLDGQGADEILAGYHKYYISHLRELYLTNYKEYKRTKHILLKNFNKHYNLDTFFFIETNASNIRETLRDIKNKYFPFASSLGLNDDFISPFRNEPPPFHIHKTLQHALLYDTTVYGLEKLLRVADKNSMAFGREIRLPFLSHKLVEYIFSLPSNFLINEGWTKYILRKSIENKLPEQIVWRKNKIGFEAPEYKWSQSKKIQELIKDSESFLIKNKIIKQKNNISFLKKIDAALLIK